MSDKREELCRERFKIAREAVAEDREEGLDDQRFHAGIDQWPEAVRRDRESDGRPTLVINRLPSFVDQVIGDARQNKPSIKARPAKDGTTELAEVYEGLIRNIEYTSRADQAYDTALESVAICGFGAFRITTEYADDDVFEQDIIIKRIVNPYTVLFDPTCQEADYSDAEYCFVYESLGREEFDEKYPNADMSGIEEAVGTGQESWFIDDKVLVAEYWYKQKTKKTIYQLEDGSVVDVLPKGQESVRSREVEAHKVMQCVVFGGGELTEPTEWAGKYIPVIGVQGKELNVDGKRMLRGLVRYAKDPQRMYNYWRTAATEAIALVPKAPFLVTPEQIEGHEAQWLDANTKSFPYLLYNSMPNSGSPQRQQAATIPTAMVQEAQICVDEMKAVTGIHDASLGNQGNEKSGKAIIARQRQGNIATFAYIDNLSRAISHAGRILVDLIPKIYDTERIVRTLGLDGKEKPVSINTLVYDEETGQYVLSNDLSVGKYDVVVETGPSYSTKRAEASESMVQLMQALPQVGQVASDLIVKAMDWPGSDDIAKRLEKSLPPGLAEKEGEEAPDPQVAQLTQQVQQLDMVIQKMSAELEESQHKREIDWYNAETNRLKATPELSQEQVHEIAYQTMQHLSTVGGPSPEARPPQPQPMQGQHQGMPPPQEMGDPSQQEGLLPMEGGAQ